MTKEKPELKTRKKYRIIAVLKAESSGFDAEHAFQLLQRQAECYTSEDWILIDAKEITDEVKNDCTIFDRQLIESCRTKWWERILLLFKKPRLGSIDANSDTEVYFKVMFGKIYVCKFKKGGEK